MLKMNDGKHSMFQGSVHDAPMRFGRDFNCNRIYFNFLIKIFLFVKMEKCHAATEKKISELHTSDWAPCIVHYLQDFL